MRLRLALVLSTAAISCATYQPLRDTTQPDKIAKASLVCNGSSDAWPGCQTDSPPVWFWKPTVISAPFEAFWTFVGDTAYPGEKIRWKITEHTLFAYRAYETVKGGDGQRVTRPGYEGEPVAAFTISSQFDVWHQYNPTTGEELPVLYEAQERPWYERQYMRVDWSQNQIAGFGNLIGAKISEILGEVHAEPVSYYVNDPNDPNYRVITDSYIDVVQRDAVTPTLQALEYGVSPYVQLSPAHVDYRSSFWRVPVSDYAPLYYPDHAFNDDAVAHFGYFREEREFYDKTRGVTDFKDYLMNRWDIWATTHVDATCKADKDCAGWDGKNNGVICDKRAPGLAEAQASPDARAGKCTKKYADRGFKPIVYFLSPQFYDDANPTQPSAIGVAYKAQACRTIQQWNEAYKDTVARLLGVAYTERNFADPLKADYVKDMDACTFHPATATPHSQTPFDPKTMDLYVLAENSKTCDANLTQGAKDSSDPTARWCIRLGDIRYSMISYVDQAGSGTPLGVATWLGDAETGEIKSAVANIFGGALDTYRGYVGDVYDMVSGNLTQEQVELGENVRDYYQNFAGNSFPPSIPQAANLVSPDALAKFQGALQQKKDQADQLKLLGPQAFDAKLSRFKGSDLEKLLVDNIEFRSMVGLNVDDPLDENMMDRVSPFRGGFQKLMEYGHSMDKVLDKYCVMHANTFIDYAVTNLVQRAKDANLTRDQAMDWITGLIFRATIDHEVGHTMGLRHNFEGSFDEENYNPEYFGIKAAFPDPAPATFAVGHPLPLTPTEFQAFNQARTDARHNREKAGVKLYQYSSIMDYGGQFYSDLAGIGEYDKAAIRFGYGQLATVYDGAPKADHSNRTTVPYYLGGQQCTTNDDCPFAKSGQSCASILNGLAKACTSWDFDANNDAANHPPIQFRFCSDERVDDRPFCNRFDEGPSSTQIVQNLAETYERNYTFNNFRRYREYYGGSYQQRIWDRYFRPMGKQFASLLYQVYYNQKSLLTSGNGSLADMLEASIQAMDFYTRVLGTPDVGEFTPNTFQTLADGTKRLLYQRTSPNCHSHTLGDGSDDPAYFHSCLGTGKYFYTSFEQGYYGAIQRIARSGTFDDKFLAMYALTNRDWGQPFANNETFPLNFYDGFKGEMLKLFTGVLGAQDDSYAPLVSYDSGKATVTYRDIWQGKLFDAVPSDFAITTPAFLPTTTDTADARYQHMDVLSPQQPEVFLKIYGLILSLSRFTVFYDETFPDYVQLYVFGEPQPHFDANGATTVQYFSPLHSRTYIGVQTPDQKSIAFPLVKEAAGWADAYTKYSALTGSQLTGLYALHKSDACRFVSGSSTTPDADCQALLVSDAKQKLTERESYLDLMYEVRQQIGLVL